MSTPSEQKDIAQNINAELDRSVASLSQTKINDIVAARTKVLSGAKQASHSVGTSLWNVLNPFINHKILVPSAVAVGAVMLVNYTNLFSTHSSAELAQVPPLPIEVMDDTIPTEDLLLLQDIEFAYWLAEQDDDKQEATL